MLKYLLSDSTKQTLSNMIKLCFDANYPYIYNKSQVNYIFNYIKDLGAELIFLEKDYIDRDYLEDYSRYYVKSAGDYGNKTSRLHFFSKKIDHKKFDKYLHDGISDEFIEEWKKSYLGFIVIKPLQKTFIGRSCLKPYNSFDNKNKIKKCLVRMYSVNLLGVKLSIEGVAFQEQDTIVSACATTSIWSALHALKWLKIEDISSCSEITCNAINHIPNSKNLFPKNQLTNKQILRAIDIEGLKHHDIKIDEMDYNSFHEVVKIYIDSGLPLLLGLKVYQCENDSEKGELYLGDHAVTVLGYRDSVDDGNKQCIYIHDNRLGPYVRATYKVDNSDPKNWSLIIQKKSDSGSWLPPHERMLPDILIGITKQKVRLSHEMAFDTMNVLCSQFNKILHQEIRERSTNTSFSSLPKASFSLKLKDISEIKSELIDFRFSDASYQNEDLDLKTLRRDFLIKSYSKHHWVASLNYDNVNCLDILFDATDIPQGNGIAGIIYKDIINANIFISFFESMGENKELYYSFLENSRYTFAGSFFSYIRPKPDNLYSYLDEKYGELRAPGYLKNDEFHGGEIYDNKTAKKYYGRTTVKLKSWIKTLIDNDDKSTVLWAICEDGALLLGKEIGNNGHPTLTGFKSARIAGEILKINGKYYINSKSGRYSTDYRLKDSYLKNAIDKFNEVFSDGRLVSPLYQ